MLTEKLNRKDNSIGLLFNDPTSVSYTHLLQSGAALATVVGVLVEVPVMLMLVRIANNTRKWFPITK